MIRAWENVAAEFPDAELIFSGSGMLVDNVRALAARLPSVTVLQLEHRDVPALLETVHVNVIASTGSEGTSLSCIEGMAAGAVPIVTTVGGLPNLVIPNYNGIVCQPTVESLTCALRRALGAPIAELSSMARKSEDMARTAFSTKAWQTRVADVISGVLLNEA
jgi:glycosyltransferase involved in cell wall biosynthesis